MKKKDYAFWGIIIILAFFSLYRANFEIKELIVTISSFISFIVIYLLNMKFIKNNKFNTFYSLVFIGHLLLSIVFNSYNLGFFLLFIFIILIAVAMSLWKNTSFEIGLFSSVSIVILLFVLLALTDLLSFSYVLLCLCLVGSIVFLIKNKGKLESFVNNNHFSEKILLFAILYLIAILSGVGRYVHIWDEYSYWAYSSKYVINKGTIYDLISNISNCKDYPPVFVMWQFIVSKFAGFSEPGMYISLTILDFIFVLPVFNKLWERKNKIIDIMFIWAVIVFPYLFNGAYMYSILYADLLLSFIVTTLFIIVNNYEEVLLKSKLPIYLLMIIITLLKANGFVYVFTILLFLYLKRLFKEKITFKNIVNGVKPYIVPAILVIIVFVGYRLFIKIPGDSSYNVRILPDVLKSDMSLKMNRGFIITFMGNLLKSFDVPVIFSFINLPLFVFDILLFFLIYIVDRKDKSDFKVLVPYILSYIAFFLVTAFSLLYSFSVYEAQGLASFGRYLNPMHLCLIVYVLYRMYELNKKYFVYILIVIFGLVGFNQATFFASDFSSKIDQVNYYHWMMDKFDVINKLDDSSRVYILNQADEDSGIMPLWYARYYVFPKYVNSSSNAITWKVKTESNSDDLSDWGLTSESFEKHLIEYGFDYVYIYSTTDELSELFENDITVKGDKLEKGELYKVVQIDSENIQLVEVE